MGTATAEHPKAGEVWWLTHRRRGSFTAKFLEDADMTQDDFVEVEVADNVPRAIKGEVIRIRTTLTLLHWRIEATT